jgi:pilus assembly protein CpaC
MIPMKLTKRIQRLIAGTSLVLSLISATAVLASPTQAPPMGDEIPLAVGRSVVLDHPDEIERVAINDDSIADAIAISTREVLIHGKKAGITTLVIWSASGDRNFFTISVAANTAQLQEHINAAFPGENVRVMVTNGVATVNGDVSSIAVAERVVAMVAGGAAATVISNLEVPPPDAERQIMIKVRFAEVQRNIARDFGLGLFSTGAGNTPASVGTKQFGNPTLTTVAGAIGQSAAGFATNFNLTDTLNIFAFRPDLNIGAVLKALESRGLSELLAEPNLITTSGKQAKLLVGGEFPVPIIQGSSSGGVTIQFKEFGIRIDFTPEFTGRGSIKMHVEPEVSALDFANAVTLQGFLIPALSTRRVSTDVELMPGQSFVIGGLIDQRIVESEAKIPVLSSIPLLGEIFKSRTKSKNNTELLVIVTPEFPRVYEAGEEAPNYEYPIPDFMEKLGITN